MDIPFEGAAMNIGELGVALNEAEVVGLRPDGDEVAMLMHAYTLPTDGAVEIDDRWALIARGVSRVRVLLRRRFGLDDPNQADDFYRSGPAIPLPDFVSLDAFFASVVVSEPMYGWNFIDDPTLTGDWPAAVSLDHVTGAPSAPHSLYWFNECWAPEAEAGDPAPHCLEGVIDFAELAVRRFDGSAVPVEEFAAAGRRWWEAFSRGDRSVIDHQAPDLPWRAGGPR